MTGRQLREALLRALPYAPNKQQDKLIDALCAYCVAPELRSTIFILNGYAGTGKTSLTAALVNALSAFNIRSVLLAPTGRAAKVFGNYAGHAAYTIHRHIYRTDPETGRFTALKENKAKPGTVFIVDESSMIDTSDHQAEGINILDDLLQFVFTGEDCRLIFLGDTAQLPPVSAENNPEIDLRQALKNRFFKVIRAVLTTTARQASDSGILYNATWLRRSMEKDEPPVPRLTVTPFTDVHAISSEDMAEELENSYRQYGMDETIIITRSNRRAVDYNVAVRNMILERTEPLSVGEVLMVAKNNYFWSTGVKGLEFIANGDMAVVRKIIGRERFADMDFADVELVFPDHDDITVELKINLSGLFSDAPALSHEQTRQLGMACIDNTLVYPPGTPDAVRLRGLRSDPYYNALQVKYGYAITCHKAQGGQWQSVFIDMGFVPEEAQGVEFYRWLYTATTRASRELHFINPQALIR